MREAKRRKKKQIGKEKQIIERDPFSETIRPKIYDIHTHIPHGINGKAKYDRNRKPPTLLFTQLETEI